REVVPRHQRRPAGGADGARRGEVGRRATCGAVEGEQVRVERGSAHGAWVSSAFAARASRRPTAEATIEAEALIGMAPGGRDPSSARSTYVHLASFTSPSPGAAAPAATPPVPA